MFYLIIELMPQFIVFVVGCHVYASCGAGVFYDNRPCPANLVWDDKLKRCEYNSTTCPGPTPRKPVYHG